MSDKPTSDLRRCMRSAPRIATPCCRRSFWSCCGRSGCNAGREVGCSRTGAEVDAAEKVGRELAASQRKTFAALIIEYKDSDAYKMPTVDAQRSPPEASCTIIVTDANVLVGKIYSRMPVVLDDANVGRWRSA
jgi:SOS response associated peptidase (SRAP)